VSYQFPSSGPFGEREQRVGEPVDARNAGERVVDRRRQRADRDLDYLCDAKLAILSERAVTADANSAIDRGLDRAGVVRRDDCCERLAAEHELAWAEPQHDQCARRVRRRDQRAVIDVLQVTALRARNDRAGLGPTQNRGVDVLNHS
jgi:hypothetical protein